MDVALTLPYKSERGRDRRKGSRHLFW